MNISIAEPTTGNKRDLEARNAISDFASIISKNAEESHFLRQEEAREAASPIVRAPKYFNPVEKDFPCLHFPLPLPTEPFLYLFIRYLQEFC